MPYYAGIGSRETPVHILESMTALAHDLSDRFHLRSGGAIGADTAFELGARPHCTIYTARSSFSDSTWNRLTEEAALHHPNWPAVVAKGPYVVRLMARNIAIILGRDLDSPASFVICWTPNGALTGGTAHGIRCARAHNIPVYNLATHHFDPTTVTATPR